VIAIHILTYFLCHDSADYSRKRFEFAISFDVSLKTLAAFTPSLENSFELSFVCCKTVLARPIFVDIALLVSLVADTTLSAKPLTTVPYVSANTFGDIRQ
jgi:hypothetical protein